MNQDFQPDLFSAPKEPEVPEQGKAQIDEPKLEVPQIEQTQIKESKIGVPRVEVAGSKGWDVSSLKRPLVIYDLEATGLDVTQALIIEFAAHKLEPNGESSQLTFLVNPGVELPEAVVEITGISDDMLKDAPSFAEVAPELVAFIEGADLSGYNIHNFDFPLLTHCLSRVGVEMPGPADRVLIDPMQILNKYERRTLGWAYKYYTGKEIGADAHRAMADVDATVGVLVEQLSRYDLEGSMTEVAETLRGPYLDSRRRLKQVDGDVIVSFGKHDGTPLGVLLTDHPDYVSWMVDKLGPEIALIVKSYVNNRT